MLRDQIVVSSGPDDEALKARFKTSLAEAEVSTRPLGGVQSPYSRNMTVDHESGPRGSQRGRTLGGQSLQTPFTLMQDLPRSRFDSHGADAAGQLPRSIGYAGMHCTTDV